MMSVLRGCCRRNRFNVVRAMICIVMLTWFRLAVNQLRHASVMSECPLKPDTLRGKQPINHEDNIRRVEQNNSDVMIGGEWKPLDCVARKRVAIIIPYRDRSDQLVLLMANLHPMLQRQKLHYRIFVVEQLGTEEFNKGIIMNTAFTVANDTMDLHCVIFHDVDLVPMDDRNYYGCSDNPRHLSVAIDSFNFTLPYPKLIGGVLGMRKEVFIELNGYSNMYWGWGAEDDDMYDRMIKHNLTFERPTIAVARYHKMNHSDQRRSSPGSRLRTHLLKHQITNDRSHTDGISSLTSRVVTIETHKLYTIITVDVGKAPVVPKFGVNLSFLFQAIRAGLTKKV